MDRGNAQPDSHPADAGIGGEQRKGSIEMNEIRDRPHDPDSESAPA